MVGAMVSLSVITALLGAHVQLPSVLIILAGLIVAVLVCMTLAYGMEKIAYRPLRKAPRLAPLITAIGMSIILQNLALMIWGRNYLTFPTLIEPTPHNILGASMTDLQMLIVALAGLLMAGLVFIVQRTRLGMAMRATAQNPQVAGLMGIDINVVISAAFVIGAALAAVAGLMVEIGRGDDSGESLRCGDGSRWIGEGRSGARLFVLGQAAGFRFLMGMI